MKEFKGTKGEWKLHNIKGYPRIDSLPEIRVGGSLIAKTGGGELDMVEANAQLIAAAPDLLAVCIHAREMCQDRVIPTENDLTIMAGRLKAAIQKALGEA